MPKKNRPRAAGRETDTDIEQVGVRTELFREAQMETLGAVSAVLDHESRNLLGALGTCVQILRRNSHITQDDKELLDIIESGSHRLNEIVSEFSTFANPRSPRFQPVDLHGLIDETLILLERDDRCSTPLFVNRELDSAVPEVQADREQLGQVLWHLFLNAVQAMGDQGQLDVETHNENKGVKIVVRDTGPGIVAKDLPHIFAPLYTTKSRGTGLGLAIVRRIVTGHGGKVSVQSDGETGSSFALWLPIDPNKI